MKLKKFPKSPKESASIDVWRKYEAKVREVKKHNDAVKKKAFEKKRLIESIRKQKA